MRKLTTIGAMALGALAVSGVCLLTPAALAEEGTGQATAAPRAGGVQLENAPAPQDGNAFFTQDPSTLNPNAPRRRKSGDGGHGETLRTRGDLLREGFRVLLK